VKYAGLVQHRPQHLIVLSILALQPKSTSQYFVSSSVSHCFAHSGPASKINIPLLCIVLSISLFCAFWPCGHISAIGLAANIHIVKVTANTDLAVTTDNIDFGEATANMSCNHLQKVWRNSR
jgi:hypothetical protein